MYIPDEIEIYRGNTAFNVKFSREEKEFIFQLIVYTGKFNLNGEQEILNKIEIKENSILKIGELIDALTLPDILHPVLKDTQISPFGKENIYLLHIKWEGWNLKFLSKKFPQLKTENLPEMYYLVKELQTLRNFLDKFLNDAERKKDMSIENFYRQVLNLFLNTFGSILPDSPWVSRSLAAVPFRTIQIKNFQNQILGKITLTPSDTGNLVRFLKFFLFNYSNEKN